MFFKVYFFVYFLILFLNFVNLTFKLFFSSFSIKLQPTRKEQKVLFLMMNAVQDVVVSPSLSQEVVQHHHHLDLVITVIFHHQILVVKQDESLVLSVANKVPIVPLTHLNAV